MAYHFGCTATWFKLVEWKCSAIWNDDGPDDYNGKKF